MTTESGTKQQLLAVSVPLMVVRRLSSKIYHTPLPQLSTFILPMQVWIGLGYIVYV